MSKSYEYEHEEYTDPSLDNLEELQRQGWIPGQVCLIQVDEHGHLGPCIPLSTLDINHLLIGLGIIFLLLCWACYTIKHLYQCKSLFVKHLTLCFLIKSPSFLYISIYLCYFSFRHHSSHKRYASACAPCPVSKTSD